MSQDRLLSNQLNQQKSEMESLKQMMITLLENNEKENILTKELLSTNKADRVLNENDSYETK